MLYFVIIFNLSLTVINIYILLKVRQWTKNLNITKKVLTNVEYQIDRVLKPAPKSVMIAQKGTNYLRFRLQILAYQWQLLQNLVNLLIWLSHQTKIKTSSNLKL